jgi:hypothetical protein
MIGTEWRPKALVAQALEFLPLRPASIAFQDGVPHMSYASEMVRREPNPVGMVSFDEIQADLPRGNR